MRGIVVIGDVVASRKILDREDFQQRLLRVLKSVNGATQPASAYTISAGDEMEAVYTRGDSLFNDVLAITTAVYPARIRFSIALGTITTKLNPTNPMLMDGPAFHIARSGVAELRKAKEILRVAAEPPVDVSLENNSARLLAIHIGRWKQRRLQLYSLMARDFAPSSIAAELRVSLASVYKSAEDGALDLVRALVADLGRSLTAKLGG